MMNDKTNKNLYKRLLAMMMAAMVVVIGFSSVVLADTGPKPECDVTVTNAPDGEYYIAFLTDEWTDIVEFSYDDSLSDRENEVIRYIEEYEDEDGYRLFKNFRKHYFKSNKDHKYNFFGDAGVLPKTYKILIVPIDGEVKVSPAITQKAFWAKMTYDYSSNTIKENYTGVYARCIPWVFVFVFITFINEGLILLAFNLFRKKNLVPFLVINLITQFLLNVVNIIWYASGNSGLYFLIWMAAETVITAIEAFWYSKKLVRKDGSVSVKRNVFYAITANLVSAFADLPVLLIMMYYPVVRR